MGVRYTDWGTEGVSNDGKIVQVQTWSVDGWGILYNKDIFKEAGITEVEDYESFKAACDKVSSYRAGRARGHLGTWLGGMTTQEEAENEGFYAGLNENIRFSQEKKDWQNHWIRWLNSKKPDTSAKTLWQTPGKTWSLDGIRRLSAMGVVYTAFPQRSRQ